MRVSVKVAVTDAGTLSFPDVSTAATMIVHCPEIAGRMKGLALTTPTCRATPASQFAVVPGLMRTRKPSRSGGGLVYSHSKRVGAVKRTNCGTGGGVVLASTR